MLETLSLSVWSLLQVLKKAKRANCVFALTDGNSLEIVSFCGLKIRAVFFVILDTEQKLHLRDWISVACGK